jgi:hypothetical protein
MVDFKSLQKKWDFQKTVTKYKDTRNFEIDKNGRFAARFFQIALAVFSYYWLSVQNAELVKMFSARFENAMPAS